MLEQVLRTMIPNEYVSNKVVELVKIKALDGATIASNHAEDLSKIQENGPAIWERLIKLQNTKEEIILELLKTHSKAGDGVEMIIRKIVDEQWRNLPNKSLLKDPVLGLDVD